MAAATLPVLSCLQLGVAPARPEKGAVKQSGGYCDATLWRSNGNLRAKGESTGSLSGGPWTGASRKERQFSVRAQAGEDALQRSDKWGEPVSLGTALLPPDVDLGKLEALLFQWGNSLTANANLPLPSPIKVDRVKGGVRLGYIRVKDGAVEDLVHIDVIVNPATADSKAYFQATRNGQYKDRVPPGEPMIMQSLLAALKKSIQLSRP